MCIVYRPRETERERKKGVGGRKAQKNHEAESCYVTGKGGAEENPVYT